MKKLALIAAGILVAAVPSTAALADVDINARIRIDRDDAALSDRGVRRIVIVTSNNNVGVCGVNPGSFVSLRRANNTEVCRYAITRSSVINEGFSPIGLHTSGSGCVGSTASPLAVVDLVDGPGVTITFTPGNGTPISGACGKFTQLSYTFCTEDNTSGGCTTPVRNFDLEISAE